MEDINQDIFCRAMQHAADSKVVAVGDVVKGKYPLSAKLADFKIVEVSVGIVFDVSSEEFNFSMIYMAIKPSQIGKVAPNELLYFRSSGGIEVCADYANGEKRVLKSWVVDDGN